MFSIEKQNDDRQVPDRFRRNFYLPVAVLLLLILFALQNIYGQQTSQLWGELPKGKYQVGYKILDEKDFSRTVLEKSGDQYIPKPREIKISVWYPATNSSALLPKMRFQDYMFAMEGNEAGASAKSEIRSRLMDSVLVQELPKAAIENLLRTQSAATKDVPFIRGERFPIIVLGQGLYYESAATHAILCEFLASNGFIIATTDLVGAHSPFVKLDAVDLEAQVRDMEFVAARAKTLENSDEKRLAVVGFDMGGLAGLVLTMRNVQVDAFASLDSGITAAHNLRLVKAMPDYDPLRVRVPLFHATHPIAELQKFRVSEDTSFLDAAQNSDRLVLRFPEMRHADFSSRPMIEFFAAKMQDDTTLNRKRLFEAAAQNLLAFLAAHLQNNRKSFELLYNQPNDVSNLKVKLTKERKPALIRLPVSEDEFLNYLHAEGAEKAAALFRKIRSQFPNEQIFREAVMNQIGYNRLYRGKADEAIRIFSLNAEAYPNSTNAYDSLAEAYMLAGNNEQAIRNYRKSLEINPNNENAKARLKQLEQDKRTTEKKSDSNN
ncbi:MAG: hypothetical protein M3209_17330 [Acidobacteriota bacterium]|nr:hypothetical protein [Acidobacteriota bacterium]